MSDRALTPEYRCLLDCLSELRLAVNADLLWLCGELHAHQLISDDNEKSLRNRNVDEADRVAKLCSLAIDKVRLDPENYHVFLRVLKKKEQLFKEIIALLGEKCSSYTHNGSETTSTSVNNHSDSELDAGMCACIKYGTCHVPVYTQVYLLAVVWQPKFAYWLGYGREVGDYRVGL